MVQPRSKTIAIIAAVAKNGVIGSNGGIPWHVPADFAHFKQATVDQTLLMGRATYDSIGRALPGRRTIVLTRDPSWSRPDVLVAHDLQSGIDAAEDLPGRRLMVAGGSHIYAEMLPHAQMQILSEIDATPPGDAHYPHWDRREWVRGLTTQMDGFSVTTWERLPAKVREYVFSLPPDAASAWWSKSWSDRLARAVRDQRRVSADPGAVDWDAVHYATMRIIMEAAEEQRRPLPPDASAASRSERRIVRLGDHVSLQDVKEIQGALMHWSDFLAPRSTLA